MLGIGVIVGDPGGVGICIYRALMTSLVTSYTGDRPKISLLLYYTFFFIRTHFIRTNRLKNDPKFKNKLRTTPASKCVKIFRTLSLRI